MIHPCCNSKGNYGKTSAEVMAWVRDYNPQIRMHIISYPCYKCSACLINRCWFKIILTPYGNIDLCQHWFRELPVARRHRSITWLDVDHSFVGFRGIHPTAVLQLVFKQLCCMMILQITFWKVCHIKESCCILSLKLYLKILPYSGVTSKLTEWIITNSG